MKNLIQKIALGIALVGAGVGVATPFAYESGKSSSQPQIFERGRLEGQEKVVISQRANFLILATKYFGNVQDLLYKSGEIQNIFGEGHSYAPSEEDIKSGKYLRYVEKVSKSFNPEIRANLAIGRAYAQGYFNLDADYKSLQKQLKN